MHHPLLQNIPFENYLSQIFLLSGLIGNYSHTQILRCFCIWNINYRQPNSLPVSGRKRILQKIFGEVFLPTKYQNRLSTNTVSYYYKYERPIFSRVVGKCYLLNQTLVNFRHGVFNNHPQEAHKRITLVSTSE